MAEALGISAVALDANLAAHLARLDEDPRLGAALQGHDFLDPVRYGRAVAGVAHGLDALALAGRPPLPGGDWDAALVCLDGPEQLPAAGAWLAALAGRLGAGRVGFFGPSVGAALGAAPVIPDAAGLLAWLVETLGLEASSKAVNAMPAYQVLPLGLYLSPEPVLGYDPGLGIAACLQSAGDLRAGAVLLGPEPLTPPELAGLAPAGEDGPSLAICCRVGDWLEHQDWQSLAQAGLVLMQWRLAPGDEQVSLQGLAKMLRGAAKAGIWNHLEPGPGFAPPGQMTTWVANNPNLAHSAGWDDALSPQGLAPLPGRPWWQSLQRPGHLLLQLRYQGLARVMRTRVLGDGGGYQVGEALEYHYEKPGEMAPALFDQVCGLAEWGGAVDPKWLRHNLERAFVIAYALEQGALVGVSSLKRPRDEFVARIREKTGLDLTGYVERGYTSVRPEHRGLGIGTKLLEGETRVARDQGRKVYSILSADNLGGQKMAQRNQTVQVAEYRSNKANKQLSVWMPQWVVDMNREQA